MAGRLSPEATGGNRAQVNSVFPRLCAPASTLLPLRSCLSGPHAIAYNAR